MTRSTSISIVAMSVFALAGGAMGQLRPMPQPGDPMPNVAGFDAEGNPLVLTRLHGKHAVIVFGCLT